MKASPKVKKGVYIIYILRDVSSAVNTILNLAITGCDTAVNCLKIPEIYAERSDAKEREKEETEKRKLLGIVNIGSVKLQLMDLQDVF